MKNKLRVMLKIVLIIAIIVCSTLLFNRVFAFEPSAMTGNADIGTAGQNMSTMGNKIVTIIRNVAIVVSVATILILGIKYMMGSAEEKAEYKKTMLPYFIGAICVFSASTLVTTIASIASQIH